MKQKLAIIPAIFHEPKVIFMDEPTAGLDPEASLMVREMIARLKGEGRTMWYVRITSMRRSDSRTSLVSSGDGSSFAPMKRLG